MGIVRMGPPQVLMLSQRSEFGIATFVETGTYLGMTATWAAQHFDHVFTIESSRPIFERAMRKLSAIKNVHALFGDSRSELKRVVDSLNSSTIFWLDSHWCGGETWGEEDQCPLLEEIRIINTSPYPHFIFIDDARMFTAPPCRPHRVQQWPSIGEVIESLNKGSHKYYSVVTEDVVIAVPQFAKESVVRYCQDVADREWQLHSMPIVKKALRQIWEGFHMLGYSMKQRLLELLARQSGA